LCVSLNNFGAQVFFSVENKLCLVFNLFFPPAEVEGTESNIQLAKVTLFFQQNKDYFEYGEE
jgi:hypothetical protein